MFQTCRIRYFEHVLGTFGSAVASQNVKFQTSVTALEMNRRRRPDAKSSISLRRGVRFSKNWRPKSTTVAKNLRKIAVFGATGGAAGGGGSNARRDARGPLEDILEQLFIIIIILEQLLLT